MAKSSKKYKAAIAQVDRTKVYELSEAVGLAKKTSYSKFPGTMDLAINIGVDPRKQSFKGAVPLPHRFGKPVRIVVFAKGQKAVEATEQGVEFVGGDDLAEKIKGGWRDFDQVLATPDMMGVVGKLGQILGPRGLMPNPKIGTVTMDVVKAIKELKAGRATFKVEKHGAVVHVAVGSVDMEETQIVENVRTVIDAIVRAKPSDAKGVFLKKMSVSSTMGPGVKIDLAEFKG